MQISVDWENLTKGQQRYLDSDSRFIFLIGGVGSGKSTAATLKIIQLNAANKNMPGLIIAQTWGALWSNIIEPLIDALAQSMPDELLPTVQGKGGPSPRLFFPDGSFAYLGSAESPKGYDGKTVAWLVGDGLEHWSVNSFRIAIARVRIRSAKRSQICLSANPKIGWLSDEATGEKKGRELITVSTRENESNLVEGYIENLCGSYSPRLQKAMIDGEFVILEGAVYEQFDSNSKTSPWIIDWQPTIQELKALPNIMAIDPGFRKSSYLFTVMTSELDTVVFDQLQPEMQSDIAIVQQINARQYPIDEMWVDRAGDNTQSAAAIDTFSVLRGIKTRRPNQRSIRSVIPPFNDLRFSVDKLRVQLGGYENLPRRILFTRQLVDRERNMQRGIFKDLGKLKYPEEKENRSISENPEKDGMAEHSTDSLRYHAVGRWLTVPQLRSRDPFILSQKSLGYILA